MIRWLVNELIDLIGFVLIAALAAVGILAMIAVYKHPNVAWTLFHFDGSGPMYDRIADAVYSVTDIIQDWMDKYYAYTD